MHAIANYHIAADDVDISEKIFGADVSSPNGKITRNKPKPVRKYDIEIPKYLIQKYHDLELAIDVLYVNAMKFMSGINR